MAYDEKKGRVELPHNIIMEGRERLSISGVEDVESFDEESVVVATFRGTLIVRGSDLHIEKLSLEQGELGIEGKVDSLQYEDVERKSGGFFSRLFR